MKFKLSAIGALLFALCLSASAQGTAFTYQGHLMDTNAPANGLYDIRAGWEGSTVFGNTASGTASVIGGGINNIASFFSATVAGGYGNTAGGNSFGATTVGGGVANTASSDFSTISGGNGNIASGVGSFIGGGGTDGSTGLFGLINTWPNKASGKATVIGGGLGNTNLGYGATIADGTFNTANGTNAMVGGGSGNSAIGTAYGYSTVGGGSGNTAVSYATVGGGIGNTANGFASFVVVGGFAGGTFCGELCRRRRLRDRRGSWQHHQQRLRDRGWGGIVRR